jgi:hypothetical protein
MFKLLLVEQPSPLRWRAGKCGEEQREKRYRGKVFVKSQWAAAAPYGPQRVVFGCGVGRIGLPGDALVERF